MSENTLAKVIYTSISIAWDLKACSPWCVLVAKTLERCSKGLGWSPDGDTYFYIKNVAPTGRMPLQVTPEGVIT